MQRDALPAAADEQLDDAQRAYLAALAAALEAAAWDGESVQAAIFATAKERDLPAGRAFAALYLAFLGRRVRARGRLAARPRWSATSSSAACNEAGAACGRPGA